MSIYMRAFVVLSLLMICTMRLSAQQKDSAICESNSCCCKNDPTPAGIMISHLHEKGDWMFSYKFMQMNMSGMLNGSKAISKDDVFANYLMAPHNMQMNMHMLMGMYGLTHRITLMAMLNYNAISMQMDMFSESSHHHAGAMPMGNNHSMNSSGLGDTKLYALFGIINTSHHQLLVSGGVSLPTGSVTIKGASDDMMYANTRLPYSMQLGSGTFDILPCINYLYQKHKITFSSQVSATLHTGKNVLGYAFGNTLSSNSWIAYQWLPFVSSSVRIEATTTGNINGVDKKLYAFNEPSANPHNYGGQMLNSYIGSVFRYNKGGWANASIALEYGLPIYQYANGIQMKQQQTALVSVQYGF